MNKSRRMKVLALCVTAVVALGVPGVTLLAQHEGHGHGRDKAKQAEKKRHRKIRKVHGEQAAHLAKALKAIEGAIHAVESDRKEEALARLRRAKKLVAGVHKGLREMRKPRLANASCPMMGSRLNPKKVPPHLTRKFKGKTVGFCCAGCPEAWDRLSDDEKDRRLRKVLHRPKKRRKQSRGL